MIMPAGMSAISSTAVSCSVYDRCMSRTNINIDDEACAQVRRRYCLKTIHELVNLALRSLASEPLQVEEARHRRTSD